MVKILCPQLLHYPRYKARKGILQSLPPSVSPMEDIRSNDLFDRWCGYKSNNKKVSPVELLLLGLLRYLVRGWTFDDCEESTAIDQDVHRSFFRVFIKFGSTVLYKKWVLTPVNLPEALSNMKEYSEAGFPGCVGSSECTHIVTDKCEYLSLYRGD